MLAGSGDGADQVEILIFFMRGSRGREAGLGDPESPERHVGSTLLPLLTFEGSVDSGESAATAEGAMTNLVSGRSLLLNGTLMNEGKKSRGSLSRIERVMILSLR